MPHPSNLSRLLPWKRTHRLAAWLVLAVLGLNQLLPIAWAWAAPPPPQIVAAVAPDVADHHHHHHQEAIAEPEARPPPQPASHADHGAPHCPLCVLFGGTAWAAPANAAFVVLAAASPDDCYRQPGAQPLAGRILGLRPAPRAPPIPA